MHYLIKDTEFEKILNSLLQIKGIHKRNLSRLRNFFEAIFYMSRAGCSWRLLPEIYGFWRSLHRRFKLWSEKNIWQQIFELIRADPDFEYLMIDSSVIRAHACAAGYGKNSHEKEALGRSKGGFTTKIHAVVDGLGNPLKFSLTGGQRHDITQAAFLIQDLKGEYLMADKGYDADHFIQLAIAKGFIPVIPSRKNRKIPRNYDEFLYQDRNRIECFFGKIKHFRRIATRYDKCASSYLSFLYFVGMLIWLR
jgi:transposase